MLSAAGQYQALPVAPTCVQLPTLQYTAEQLIRSCLRKEEGKQWMKSVMDTESALSKDAKRFLSSSQSWEAVLDLSNQCLQACLPSIPSCCYHCLIATAVAACPNCCCWYHVTTLLLLQLLSYSSSYCCCCCCHCSAAAVSDAAPVAPVTA